MCWTVFVLTLVLCSYVCEGYYNDYYNRPENVTCDDTMWYSTNNGHFFKDNEFSHIDDFNDENALAVFKNVQKKSYRKRLICRRWNHHCVPWSHKAGFKCCSDLTCKCNLWMQNCRCVSKLWGK